MVVLGRPIKANILGPPWAHNPMADFPLDTTTVFLFSMGKKRIAVAFLKHVRGLKKKKITHPGRFSHRGTVPCLSSQDIKLSNFHQITHLLVRVDVPQITELITARSKASRGSISLRGWARGLVGKRMVLAREPGDSHAKMPPSLPPSPSGQENCLASSAPGLKPHAFRAPGPRGLRRESAQRP